MNRVTAAVILIGLLLISPILLLVFFVTELGKYVEALYGGYDGWYWGGRE